MISSSVYPPTQAGRISLSKKEENLGSNTQESLNTENKEKNINHHKLVKSHTINIKMNSIKRRQTLWTSTQLSAEIAQNYPILTSIILTSLSLSSQTTKEKLPGKQEV